jgi:hypothetical protein
MAIYGHFSRFSKPRLPIQKGKKKGKMDFFLLPQNGHGHMEMGQKAILNGLDSPT